MLRNIVSILRLCCRTTAVGHMIENKGVHAVTGSSSWGLSYDSAPASRLLAPAPHHQISRGTYNSCALPRPGLPITGVSLEGTPCLRQGKHLAARTAYSDV
ncbi:hypothetical protein XPA_003216 [Xanthoria parietina]